MAGKTLSVFPCRTPFPLKSRFRLAEPVFATVVVAFGRYPASQQALPVGRQARARAFEFSTGVLWISP